MARLSADIALGELSAAGEALDPLRPEVGEVRPKHAGRVGRHAAVGRADPYAFEVAHRRLAWMLRISASLNVGLFALLALALGAIATLVPLKTTEIALVHADAQDNRLYRIEPLSQTVEGFDLVLEDKARRYVRLLLEIDPITQTQRFREAFRMTDRAFYERFRKDRIESQAVQDAIASGLTRSVMVESVDRIDESGGIYKYAVDFVQTDERGGAVVERKKLRAYLSLTLRARDDVPEADKYENPLGITVLDLVLKSRGNS